MLLQTILPAVPAHASTYEAATRAPIEKIFEQDELPDVADTDEQPPDDDLLSASDDVFVVPPIKTEPVEPEQALPSAPVNLEIRTDHLFLRAGQKTGVSVTAIGTSELNTEGLMLTLTLPPMLVPEEVGAQLTWMLPDLPLKQKFTQTVTVRATEDAFGIAGIQATVADSERYFGHGEAIEVGIVGEKQKIQEQEISAASLTSNRLTASGLALENAAGNVTLLVSPNAAEAGTEFTYTELFHADATKSQAASSQAESSNEDNTNQLFVPLVVSGQTSASRAGPVAKVTPKLVDGVYAYQMWQLDATKDDTDVARFGDDVKLYVDASWLADQGVDTDSLKLWTRETAEDEWQLLDYHYDAETNLFAADLAHFSEFSLGDGLSSSGHRLPSIEGFSSDRHTGAASVHYPIDAPAGLGGLSPGVSLSYSSMESDNNYAQEGAEYKTQASEAGYGWNLGGISHIVEAGKDRDGNSVYSMILNGTSVTIRSETDYRPDGSEFYEWRTNPRLFAKIERLGSSSSGSGTAEINNYYYWRVTTTDGTKYEFGNVNHVGNQNGFNPNYVNEYNHADPTSTYIGSYGGQYRRYARQWNIRRVVDTLGNQMFYDYRGEKNKITSCIDDDFINYGNSSEADDRNWYTRSLYPTQIRWSHNPNATNPGYKLRMRFLYSGSERQDYQVFEWGDFNCNQARFGKKNQLTSVRVEALVGTSWKLVSRHDLIQSHNTYSDHDGDNQKRLILNQIKSFGSSHGHLNTHSFGYASWDVNRVYLRSADNGQGGKVNYVYKQQLVECDDGCPVINHLSGPVRTRHPVAWTITEDGQGNANAVKHNYGANFSNNSELRWGRIADSGRFLGFNQVQTTFYDKVAMSSLTLPADAVNGADAFSTSSNNVLMNRVLKFERQKFYQLRPEASDDNDDCDRLCNPDPRYGKTKLHEVYSSTNTALANLYAQTVTEWGALRRFNGTWDETDQMFKISNNANNQTNIHYTFWQRQNSVTTWVDGALNKQVFSYDSAQQNGQQFGNLTRTDEYAATSNNVQDPNSPPNQTLQRRTYVEYFPNTSNRVVNKPARVVIADANNNCVAESRTTYDNATPNWAYNSPPGPGLPATVKTRLTGSCSLPTSTPKPAATHYDGQWSMAVTYYDYANGGQPIQQRQLGKTDSDDLVITTEYDDFYKLFPIKQSNPNKSGFEETGQYYGVNMSIGSAGAFWGAMAEHCGVNQVCTRQRYDQHGRPTHRWESVSKGSTWGVEDDAETQWEYFEHGDDGLTTSAVLESRAPHHCGNFVRKHYDGLGRLVKEQSPDQFHSADNNSCTPWTPGNNVYIDREIDVGYDYDGLSRMTRSTAPRLIKENWVNRPIVWSNLTTMTYDVLGRQKIVTAPNGEPTLYGYSGRYASISQRGPSGSGPYTMLSWTRTDELGKLKETRDYDHNGSNWNVKGKIQFTHDVLGNLTSMVNVDGDTSTMIYDKGGRKTYMDDPDLGAWSYTYNRLGQLIRQTDGRTSSTCLYYDDDTGRLEGKYFLYGSCPSNPSMYNIRYKYDQGHGTAYSYRDGTNVASNRSRGQLTEVSYEGENGYKKQIKYDNRGRVALENVYIPETWNPNWVQPSGFVGGWHTVATPYTTEYQYDSYNRQNVTIYPDNDRVTINEFNSMGLPRELISSKQNNLVTNAWYAPNGAPTYHRLDRHKNSLHRRWFYHSYSLDNYRLKEIRLGTSSKTALDASFDRLRLEYLNYDSNGNITQLREKYQAHTQETFNFSYDGQNRLLNNHGSTGDYVWKNSGNLTNFEGTSQSHNESQPHAVSTAGADTFTYDANGNRIERKTNGNSNQQLRWGWENQLSQVLDGYGNRIEFYLYDDTGRRIRKQDKDGNITYYVNAFYEVKTGPAVVSAASVETNSEAEILDSETEIVDNVVDNDVAVNDIELTPEEQMDIAEQIAVTPQDSPYADMTEEEYMALSRAERSDNERVQAASAPTAAVSGEVTKYYYFNGQRIGMVEGANGWFRYLHADHLGSTVAATTWGTGIPAAYRYKYNAFGSTRNGSSLPTDHQYTGQKHDELTGLYYYNARYYDPTIGQFISPDTIVPDPTNVLDYNRYMYVRGNPLMYNDPSGHQSQSVNLINALLTAAEELGFKATAVTIYAGGNGSAGAGLHGEAASELHLTFNWYSGELMLSNANSAGLKGGWMIDNSAGIHAGGSLHFNASSTQSIENASIYVAGSAEADLLVEGGGSLTLSRSADFKDWNKNGEFDITSESFSALTPTTPDGLDPVFETPVYALSVDATIGGDLVPNIGEGAISVGVQDNNGLKTVNLYTPFRWISSLFSD